MKDFKMGWKLKKSTLPFAIILATAFFSHEFSLAEEREPTSAASSDAGSQNNTEADKSGFWLLRPVPKELMRDFAADRPGATDSPHTVDAGHFQLELSLFEHTRQSSDAGSSDQNSFGNLSLGAGLTQSLELQFIFDGYSRTNNGGEISSGAGNLGTRLKWNLLGNDGGPIAVGIIPSIHYPSGSSQVASSQIEWGLSIPVALSLPAGYSLSIMPGWQRTLRDDQSGYQNLFTGGVVLGHDLFGSFGGFGQISAISTSSGGQDDPSTAVSTGFGFTYKAGTNIQLDAGSDFGLTSAADDYHLSLGVVIRY